MIRIKLSHRRRNLEFRPIYRPRDRKVGEAALFWRFVRNYLLPYRRIILICVLLAALDSCGSFYLIAWYTRVVVDKVLVVRPAEAPPVAAAGFHEAPRDFARMNADDRRAHPQQLLGVHRALETVSVAGRRPPRAGSLLAGLFFLYLLTILGGNLINRLSTRQRIVVGRRITNRLRDDMHDHVIRLTISAQSVHTPGRLMARILSDVEAVQEYMLTLIVNASSQLIMVLVGMFLLLMIDWRIALMVLLIMPLYVIIYRVARPHLRRTNQELRHTNACLYGLVSQKLDAIRLIQSTNREKRELLAFHRLAGCYLRDSMHQAFVGSLSGRLAEMVSALGTNGAVFLYGMQEVLAGRITLGGMLYAYATAASLFTPVLALSRLNMVVANLLVSLQRLAEIMDEPAVIADAPGARDLIVPLRQGIRIAGLQFGYDRKQPPVLRGIDLDIPTGTWMCIMGPSGSGKTTLLYLLARLLERTAGDIMLDGVPINKIRLESLRQHIALVPQEPQILSGTVRDNICYGRPGAEPGEIMAAAKAAEFHDFIVSMPVQYETLLGEKGASLSGGQRQRLSLARALLTRPDILLLDDCTSALDAETEYRIQETLTRVLRGKTAVLVSQRVSMVQRCQRVCVLQDGRITEIGAPEELLERGGYYARLYAQQTG